MRIQYLSNSTLISDSANSIHVIRMTNAMADLGHDVTLHGKKGRGEDEEVYKYYGLKVRSNFKLVRHDVGVNILLSLLTQIKALFTFLPIGGLISILFARTKKFRQKFDHESDLVFARNQYWLLTMSDTKKPFVYESHSPPQNYFQKWVEKSLFSKSNFKLLVVISDKLKEIYIQQFPHIKDKIIVAHDAADDPGQSFVENINNRDVFKNIGYVGHLYKGRGIEIIIETAKLCPRLCFHIIGGKKENIEDIKSKFDIPDNIIFYGHLPPAELQKHFIKFDAVLAPYQSKVAVAGNRNDTSSFMSPLKIFEYMSYGLPILCSDMPVLREVLRHNENSILLPPDVVSEWVNALQELENNNQLRRKISVNARKDFLSHYTWQKRAEFILSKTM